MAADTHTSAGSGDWSTSGTWDIGVPHDGDRVVILNTHTVTIDDSASATISLTGVTTNFYAIDIQAGGKLQYLYTATVDHTLVLTGNLNVAGTLEIGTAANPIPSTRTFTIKIQCSADGDYGILVPAGGVFRCRGYNRTGWKATVTSDITAGDTHIHVDSSTGFAANDDVVIAGTGRGTTMEWERRTLTGVNGNGTSLEFSSGLTYARTGLTAPIRCDVIQLKRNIVITANTTSAVTFLYATGTATVIDCSWVEFSYLGENSDGPPGKKGIHISATTGTSALSYCSIHDCEDWGLFCTGNYANLTIENLAAHNLNSAGAASTAGVNFGSSTGTGTSIDNLILIGGGGGSSSSLVGVQFYCESGYCDIGTIIVANWSSTGSSSCGIYVYPNNNGWPGNAIDALISYSNAVFGIRVSSLTNFSITTLTSFRNNSSGLYWAGACTNGTITTLNLIGNTSYGQTGAAGIVATDITVLGGSIKGEASFSQVNGIYVPGRYGTLLHGDLFNVDFGVHTGTSSGDIRATQYVNIKLVLHACEMKSSVPVLDSGMLSTAYVRCEDYDDTVGAMKTWVSGGTIEKDSSGGRTGAAVKLTPNSATAYSLQSSTRQVAVASGQTVTPHVYIKETSSPHYTGSRTKLFVKKNVRMGIASDTELDVAAHDDGNYQELTGTTSAVSADGILEFYVACDGTAGSVYVDDWSVS